MKRIVSVVLTFALLFGMASGLAGCSGNDSYLTRRQWITQLAERFGMDNTVSETPYFKDVTPEDTSYFYIQSCADWGVLTNAENENFEPDKDATVEFALESAILASGVDIGEMSCVDYALSEGIIKDKGFISVRGRLTQDKANEIIAWTQDIYLNGAVEPKAIVEYKDNVQSLNEHTEITEINEGEYVVPGDIAQSLKNGDLLMMPDADYPDGVGVKVSDVVVNDDGTATVITVEPEIEELLENLDVAGPVSFGMEDIQLAEGVSFAGSASPAYNHGMNSGDGYVTTLQNTLQQNHQAVNLANGFIPDINLKVNFTKGTIAINPEWDSLLGLGESFSLGGEGKYVATDPNNPDSSDGQMGAGVLAEKTSVLPVGSAYGNSAYKNQLAINAYKDGKISMDELKKELNLTKDQEEKNPKRMENKFKAGYSIEGGLTISDIKITTEAKYNIVTGIKASLAIDYNVEFSGSVTGYISNSLNLMTVRVPIATGVTIDVKFYLCVDANGELTVKVSMANTTKYSIDGLKVKKSTKASKPDITKEISISIDFGPKISAELCLAGYPLIDVGIKAVARGKTSAKANYTTDYTVGVDEENRETITIERKTLWTVQADLYLPIVTLEVNANPKSIGNKLNLNASWTLIGEEKAPIHFSVGATAPIVIWSEKFTLVGNEKEEDSTVPSENTEPGTENGDAIIGEQLTIDTYFVNLGQGCNGRISVLTIPKGYTVSELIWTSSNTDVVTVSGGEITAVGSGIATITVRTSDGQYYQQCSVSVGGEDQVDIDILLMNLPVLTY